MKKIAFLLSILYGCLFSHESFSQKTKIDSMILVSKTTIEDTVKVNLLNQISKESYLTGEYDQSKKYSKQALLLSEQINFESGKATANLNNGITLFLEGDYPEALKKCSIAMAIGEKIKDKKLVANCYNSLGLVNTYQSKYSEAVKLHQEALKNYKEIADSSGIGKSYNNLGIIYEEQGNYTEAIKFYFASLKIAEARHDKKSIADAYFNLGNVYSAQKSYVESIKNYSPALKLYEEIESKHGIALCYVNMGNSYQELDSLELALNLSQRAFEILKDMGKKVTAAQTKNVIAHINTKLGNYSQALADYIAALKLFSDIGDTLNISTSYRGIGEVYFYKGLYNEALKNFNIGLEMAKVVGFNPNIVAFYGSIAEVYEKKNDYKNAYLNHKLYFTLNDSLLNETKSKQESEMKIRFETVEKENEIVVLNKDKAIQEAEIKKQKLLKYSFIGGLGLVIILLLIGYSYYRAHQILRLQNIRNKISGDLHDDIGSTLNSISIYSEVAKKKDDQQDEALEMIGEASRKIIDAMSDIVWTINPDNDSFAKIIFRMKSLAYNLFRAKKIEFNFHADELLNDKKLSIEERRNFYLIFKEAVNNLVKYSNASHVAITLSNENNYVNLRIQDDGIGFDMAAETQGNGLKNMKRRAEEMNAVFKIESSKGNGTQMELILKA